ncbi:hypothetical protein BX661DRAFT_185882 [Kickxella alabastrina]|uniref:uncharacterized protein n=1 Tax=Kickxella alabastrina TaxID=61397 RepID=UPI00221EA521|nr:uncharacterized protein BX661DRAFT_185882 [Kickxella alabastrina]KAI7824288.1 hypothetical protein BX661DRAFT_185882 [Kickxella alabastrina]
MSGNDELKRQIAQLESAINQRKHMQSTALSGPARYSATRQPSYRYTPIRPAVRSSRNMKLIVKPDSPGPAATENLSQDGVKYVTTANKLFRVGGGSTIGAVAHPRPQYRPPQYRPQQYRPLVIGGLNNGAMSAAYSNRQRKVDIDGETYIRKGRGNKLVRASEVPGPGSVEPRLKGNRIVSIEGENFVRTVRGSLIRMSALRSFKMQRSVPSPQMRQHRQRLCTKFVYGKCNHSAEECAYSHELTPETVPICSHFQRDKCLKSDCVFIHNKLSLNAPICREFVKKGYCKKGRRCLHRHVWECPDWVEKGKCPDEKCKLPHPTPRNREKEADDLKALKEEEELFMRHYIQRPVFSKDASAHNAGAESEHISDLEYSDDEECLSEDLSGDEADELLKWYDDNYLEQQEQPAAAS